MAIDLSPAAQSDWQVAVTKHRVKTRVDGDLVRELKKTGCELQAAQTVLGTSGKLEIFEAFYGG